MIPKEQTQQNYDRLSRWYDLFASSEKKFTEAGLQLLGAITGERILDIGFGTGHSLAQLSQQVGRSGLTAGVELSSGMIERARKRIQSQGQGGCVDIIQGDGRLLPFARNSFDGVFMSFTLELFSDEEMSIVLKECWRVLMVDGRLGVVSMAKQDGIVCRLYERGHARWPDVLDCRPIKLKKRLEAGGFRVQALLGMKMWGLPVDIALGRPL